MKRRIVIILIIGLLLAAGTISLFLLSKDTPAEVTTNQPATEVVNEPLVEEPEKYQGQNTVVANSFQVTVPNGWVVSVSSAPSFTAIMFSRPNQLGDLVYQKETTPTIDYNGIAAWSGLTEHFFIVAPASGKEFNPSLHQQVASETFTFDDGIIGQKYTVTKDANDARAWGGLLRDDHWIGQTYIYSNGGKTIEAHLARYPSSTIDVSFYEEVVRSIQFATIES